MTEKVRSRSSFSAEWCARLVVSIALLSLLELCFVVPLLPAAFSEWIGSLHLWLALAGLYGLGALPIGAVVVLVERRVGQLPWPKPLTVLTGVTGVALATVALSQLRGKLHTKRDEFPTHIDRLETVVMAAALVGIAALSVLLLTAIWRRVLSSAPNLGQPRPITVFVVGAASVSALATAHLILAPVHLDRLAGIAGFAALASAILSVRLAWPQVGARARRAGPIALALVILVGTLVSLRNDHANFVIHGHCRTGQAFAAAWRSAADIDNDGSSPTWLGGADCAEGDPTRHPGAIEIVGDGVDQDCRGGDDPTASTPSRETLWAGCELPSSPLSAVYIVLDTLRADALSPHIMPRLSQFASGAFLYTRAYAPATHTRISMPGLMTGASLGAYLNDGPDASDKNPPIGELFRRAGRRTGSYSYLKIDPALTRGIEEKNHQFVDRFARDAKHALTSANTTNGAIEFLSRDLSRPFFLWLHYSDAHAPYVDPRDPMFARPDDTPYARTARYLDFHLGRFLSALINSPLGATTLIAVTSDHGEDLGIRGREGHGPDVFESTIHIPLVLRVPGCAPRVFDQPVSARTVAPTLARLSNLETRHASLLEPADQSATLPVVTEAVLPGVAHRRAIIGSRYKLMVDVRNGGRLLFDLEADPGETRNIYTAQPNRAEEMEQAYQRWLDRN